MYFFELIKTCDKETMIQNFLKKVSDSSKTNLVETHLRKALKCIDETEPNKNDNCIIFIDKYTNEEEVCDDVYMLDKSNSEKYALLINPWADTLGYLVDSDSVSKYGEEKLALRKNLCKNENCSKKRCLVDQPEQADLIFYSIF